MNQVSEESPKPPTSVAALAYLTSFGGQTMETRTMQRRNVLHILGTGALASALLLCSDAARAEEHHPHIREAIKALREAKKDLKERAKIFGGHGEKALKAVDAAIEQLEKALEFAEKK